MKNIAKKKRKIGGNMMKHRILSGLLILSLILYFIPDFLPGTAFALDLDELELPEEYFDNYSDFPDGVFMSVDAQTAREYLQIMEELERKASERLAEFHGDSYVIPPYFVELRDLDGNGCAELLVVDFIVPALWESAGGSPGQSAGVNVGFDIYSSDGPIGGWWADIFHTEYMEPLYVIDGPYIVATSSRYYTDYSAGIYKMEQGQLKTVFETFYYDDALYSDGEDDVQYKYTDSEGKVYQEQLPSSSSSHYQDFDHMENIRQKAASLGIDISEDNSYSYDIDSGGIGGVSYPWLAENSVALIKNHLERIIAVAEQEQAILPPTDPICHDITDVISLWDFAFEAGDFDVTQGDPIPTNYTFDWFRKEDRLVASNQDMQGLETFIRSLTPEYQDLMRRTYDYYWTNDTAYNEYNDLLVHEMDFDALKGYVTGLFGADFDLTSYLRQAVPWQEVSCFQPVEDAQGKWYCVDGDISTGIPWEEHRVHTIADVGDGFYTAYMSSIYRDDEVRGESSHYMLLRKAPEDAPVPYQIVKMGEGLPSTSEIAHVKQRLLEPNTQYDYDKVSGFTTPQEYVDYLEEQLKGLQGEQINEKGRQETTNYIQFLYENAVSVSLSAKRNRIAITGQSVESAVTELSKVQRQVEELLKKYHVTLNKAPHPSIALSVSPLNWKKTIHVELRTDLGEKLGQYSISIALGDSRHALRLSSQEINALLDTYGTLEIQLKQTGQRTYKISFLDSENDTIAKLKTAVTIVLPAENELSTVFISYANGNDNWGGQFDAANRAIRFATPYSGQYEVIENEVAISDISDLDPKIQNAIAFMVSKGYFTLQDGMFHPQAPLTRYDFMQALVGMFFALDRNLKTSFPDVPKESPYYPYGASAEAKGIAKGFSDGTFSGEFNITREQVAALAGRTLVDQKDYVYPPDNAPYLTFEDAASISDWAKQDVALAVQTELIDKTGVFEPRRDITRAEAADLLYRLFMMLYETAPIASKHHADGKGQSLPDIRIPLACATLGAGGIGFYIYKRKKG